MRRGRWTIDATHSGWSADDASMPSRVWSPPTTSRSGTLRSRTFFVRPDARCRVTAAGGWTGARDIGGTSVTGRTRYSPLQSLPLSFAAALEPILRAAASIPGIMVGTRYIPGNAFRIRTFYHRSSMWRDVGRLLILTFWIRFVPEAPWASWSAFDESSFAELTRLRTSTQAAIATHP